MTSVSSGYSRTSIIAHWLAAFTVIALFFTHESERGSAMQTFHISGGALLGVFLFWRVFRRPVRGIAEKPEQAAVLNLTSQIVLWGLLTSIFVVTITGYLLPWSMGRSLDLFGLVQIPSPLNGSRDLHEFFEEVHNISGHVIMPLVGLHILGALKHLIIDKDGIMTRMFKPVSGGR